MAENTEHSSPLMSYDAPAELVETFISQLRQRPTFDRISEEKWQELTEHSPNLRHFITATSVEISPQDPLLREQVTGSMLGLLALLEEVKTNDELEKVLATGSSHDTVSQKTHRRRYAARLALSAVGATITGRIGKLSNTTS